MFGEDLDIGFYAQDAYAAYIAEAATALSIVPDFCNARGAAVDVVFDGPFLAENAFVEAAASLRRDVAGKGSRSIWERLAHQTQTEVMKEKRRVVLHAWIEKLNGPRKVQLTEYVHLYRPADQQQQQTGRSSDPAEPHAATASEEQREKVTAHRRVLGSLDFLLHLSTRDLLQVGEANPAEDPLHMDRYDGDALSASSGDGGDAIAAACAIRDALERRDDVAVARNAVDTVIKFARLAEEHAGKVATVYADVAGEEEYLRFES